MKQKRYACSKRRTWNLPHVRLTTNLQSGLPLRRLVRKGEFSIYINGKHDNIIVTCKSSPSLIIANSYMQTMHASVPSISRQKFQFLQEVHLCQQKKSSTILHKKRSVIALAIINPVTIMIKTNASTLSTITLFS